MMSLRENITAVIETCFSETKDEIQDTAISRILELIRADRKTESSSEIPDNCEDEDIFEYCPRCGMRILVSKPKDEPQMGDAKPIPLSNRVTHIKDEPQLERSE